MENDANYPSWGVYWRWFKMDPWFVPRYYIRDLWHSRSPLSSTTLVHNAFFSPECPRESVKEFEQHLCEYESMLWPLGMMLPFVNTKGVIRNILGWNEGGKRLLVVAGEKDALMGVTLMSQMADVYRRIVARLLPWLSEDEKGNDKKADSDRVGFEVVSGSGHHYQNDINWREAAAKIQDFLEQLD